MLQSEADIFKIDNIELELLCTPLQSVNFNVKTFFDLLIHGPSFSSLVIGSLFINR